MCGIMGFSGPPNPELQKHLASLLKHRGPDGQDHVANLAATIGAVRLAISDPKNGQNPIVVETPRGAICFAMNGEVYNASRLVELIRLKPTTKCDTEAVALAWTERGPSLLSGLEGMFAFAAYDGRVTTLVRDRFGIKPLFYCETVGDDPEMVFASEPATLARIGEDKPIIDECALDLYLALRYIPSPMTAYATVRVVPTLPNYLVWDRRRGEIAPCRIVMTTDHGRVASEENAIAGILNRLKAAVTARITADVPVAILLSGGVDSSLVASLAIRVAVEAAGRPLDAFVLRYVCQSPDKQADYEAAVQVANQLGLILHTVDVTWDDFKADLSSVVQALGQPYAGCISGYWLYKAAHEAGFKAVITGDGADELFGSYKTHREAAIGDRAPFDVIRDSFLFSSKSRQALTGIRPVAECWLEHALHQLTYRKDWDDTLDRVLQFEVAYPLADNVLVYADRLGMAWGVEVRPAFLDEKLAEFANRISSNLKIAPGGVTKYILKRAAIRAGLPPEIINRPKVGFIPPLDEWLWKDENWVREKLDSQIVSRGLLSSAAVTSIVDQYYAGDRSKYGTDIWSLIMLQEWLNCLK